MLLHGVLESEHSEKIDNATCCRALKITALTALNDGDVKPVKSETKSTGSVLPYVGVASLGAILFGYHLGVVNGALEYLAKDLGIADNAVLQGWIVSTLLAGATVGSFTGGSLADQFGRTKTFLLDAIPLTVGAFLCATATNVQTMIIGRLLAGIGIGISSAIVPLYISEQKKIVEAEKAIKTLYGEGKVAEVMADLSASGQGSEEQDAGWFDLFSKRYFKVVSVGAALFLFQQLAGINAVVYYSTSVFRTAGVASDVAASALVGAANVFGTMIASSLMDKKGRKSLLTTSFSGMAVSMLLLSLSFTWKALAPYSGPLAVIGTVLYVLSFSLGAGPVPALLLPEIFASRIRAKAVALSLGMHWISNFVIGLYFL
nr:plastidic glucose transporter 4-like [Tanacetum cinerariifolium]